MTRLLKRLPNHLGPLTSEQPLARLALPTLLTALVVVAGLLFGGSAALQPPRPNIVFILADDLGYGDLGNYGNEQIQTPHLDRMADDGTRFTDFYAISPICSPSRAGLLTGRYPVRMGVNGVFFPESWTGLASEETTLAEVLHEAGYATGMVGKWHLGHHRQYLPLQQGFDEYFGIPYSNDMAGVVYLRGNEVVEDSVDQHFTTQRYTQEAIDFIERHQDEPFFLYLAHTMPHVPLYASPQFEGRSEAGLYGDVVEELDWSTGEILHRLEELGLEENTLVVFTSDNGPWLVMQDHAGTAGPLRGGKMYTFEGGMRVPAIVRWPSEVPVGTVQTGVATMLDWFPTFRALAGAAPAAGPLIDGHDLSAVLRGEAPSAHDELAYYMDGELRAYRDGDWKIKLPYEGHQGARWISAVPAHDTLLFDLRADPGEQQNLAAVRPAKLAEMAAALDSFRRALGPTPPSLLLRRPADESHYEHLARQREAGAE